MKNGRRFGAPPKRYTPPERPTGRINVSDPDSRTLKTPRGFLQGYNAQAVCNEQQIIVAAEVSISSADFGQMAPMIDKARDELAAAGVTDQPDVVLADAGGGRGDTARRCFPTSERASRTYATACMEGRSRPGTVSACRLSSARAWKQRAWRTSDPRTVAPR